MLVIGFHPPYFFTSVRWGRGLHLNVVENVWISGQISESYLNEIASKEIIDTVKNHALEIEIA